MTLCDFLNPAVPLGERVRHDLGVTFAGACSNYQRNSWRFAFVIFYFLPWFGERCV